MIKFVCPHCGSEEFEIYDEVGLEEETLMKLCVCYDCNKQFEIVYKVVEIRRVE